MAVVETVSCINLRNVKWLYRGEGNANLVITLPHDKIILRFEKCNDELKDSSNIVSEREQKLKRDILFYKQIIVPFMGKVFLQPPTLALINEEEIAVLNRELLNQRPKYRLNKAVCYPLATLHPDYTYLPPIFDQRERKNGFVSNNSEPQNNIYCIEIKPKQGWVYPTDKRHPKCTYCLNQYLKLKKKRVQRISHYCPLDLFSGDMPRMKRALKNLLVTPQNNLKIFQNGKLIYSDDFKGDFVKILRDWLEPNQNGKKLCFTRLVDKWSDLLANALLRELSEEPAYSLLSTCDQQVNQNGPLEGSPLFGIMEPCDWSTGVLPNNCILNKILTMQKLQDMPFSTVFKFYSGMKNEEEDYTYVERLLNSPKSPGPVPKYLLSTTAKDCSIFISFQRTQSTIANNLHYIQDCDGVPFCMNIGLSDVDPKPLSCIEKHYKRDQDVVDTVIHYLGETR